MIESRQLLNGACPNHPAAEMWRQHRDALASYYNAALEHCLRVHCINTQLQPMPHGSVILPPWFGGRIHSNHRARLLTKYPAFYSQYGWTESFTELNYWPSRQGGVLDAQL